MKQNEKKLLKVYDSALDAANELSCALGKLSNLATDIFGEELTADICGGGEIEFRRNGENGYVDDDCCLRIEDLLAILKRQK